MGGAGLLRPGPYAGISSFRAHQNRVPPSSEPGTDYYMPTGTPIHAAADGVISDIGGSVVPATGRYIRIQMDMGLSIRYLHLSRWVAKRGQRVARGEIIAYSGASGYGSEFFGEPERNAAFWRETGGDHVHVTLDYARKDPEDYMTDTPTGSLAGGGSTDLKEWDEMATKDDVKAAFREALAEGGFGAAHIIRDRDRQSVLFVDELGTDSLLEFADPNMGNQELQEAAFSAFGKTELGARHTDIALALANRRWAAKLEQIGNAISAKVITGLKGAAPALDPDLVKTAVRDALAGATVEADVDDATIDAIANRVLDRQHERLAS